MKTTILMISILASFAYSEGETTEDKCISKADLEKLGFTNVLETPVDNTTAEGTKKACGSFEKVCVDPEELQNEGKAILENYRTGVKAQLKSVKGVHKHLTKALFKLKGAWADENKQTKIKENLEEADVTQVEELLKKCNETECTILDESTIEDMNTHKECFKALMKSSVQATCFLLSSKAHTYFSTDGESGVSKVQVQESSAKAVFDNCATYVITQCELVNMFGIYRKIRKKTSEKMEGRAQKMETACANVSKLVSCKDDLSSCDSSFVAEVFEAFAVAGGKDTTPGPAPEVVDAEADNAAATETELENTTGRLLQSVYEMYSVADRVLESTASGTCEYTVSSNGYNLAGTESGIEVEAFISASIWGLAIVSSLIMLFK
jgi:hypothetical protein